MTILNTVSSTAGIPANKLIADKANPPMERNKINFLAEMIVEDMIANPSNAKGDYDNFTQSCTHSQKSASSLSCIQKNKWRDKLMAKNLMKIDGKDRKVPDFILTNQDSLFITNDDFIRTTEERHLRASQAIWKKLADAGDIYLDKYVGWYSVRDEAYYDEKELEDDPDKSGRKLAPSGAPVEWVEEPSYFFRLSSYAQPLLDYYASHPDFIMPETRKNEIISFVRRGLRDLSIRAVFYVFEEQGPLRPGEILDFVAISENHPNAYI